MKDSYIKTIREAAIKANPDILKLEFMCRLHSGQEGHNDTYICDLEDGSHLLLDSDMKRFRWHGRIVSEQILGRDIRLADCLYALMQTK